MQGYNQSQSALQQMLQGPVPQEDNELVDICIPDVWTPEGKDAKPISIYCTVEVCRSHRPEFVLDEKQGEPVPILSADGKPQIMRDSEGRTVFQRDADGKLLKDDKGNSVPAVRYQTKLSGRYGTVMNFYRNIRYHDGDDTKYIDADMSAEDREKARVAGKLQRSQTFNPTHCYPGVGDPSGEAGDLTKLTWPKGVSPEMRAAWHRETFNGQLSTLLMGIDGRGRQLNAAYRVPAKAIPAKK